MGQRTAAVDSYIAKSPEYGPRTRRPGRPSTAFPPSARRDYVEWLTEAKRADTRGKRLETTIEWLAQGKRRHWKYESC